MSLEQLSRLRQGVYRLAGAGFSDPKGEFLDITAGIVPVLDELGLFDFAFGPAVAAAAAALSDSEPLELAVAHAALFGAGAAGSACPPQEAYHVADAGAVARIQSELRRTYLDYGLAVASRATESEDHVSTELTAMSMLCGIEAEQRRTLGTTAEVVGWEMNFLNEHVLRWVPDFCDGVASLDRHPAYTTLAGGVRAFLAHERQLVPWLAGLESVERP